MSLINDALKRAKQAQPPPASSGPPLRPIEPEAYVRHGLGVLLPISMTLVALFGLVLLWELYQRRDSTRLVQPTQPMVQYPAVPAETPTSPKTSLSPASNPARSAAATPSPVVLEPTRSVSTSTPASNAAVVSQPTSESTGAAASSAMAAQPQELTATNTVAAFQPVMPKVTPLRLQGIVFDPKKPSAVINGKTLFLRDRIGEFRVTAIRQDSVTVVGVGHTNLLTLEP